MNSVLLEPNAAARAAARILAIEPDPARAHMLSRAFRRLVHLDVKIVASTDEAIESIGGRMPDLVMTSTFLAPADEAVLTAHVRRMREASHLQIINLPYFLESDEASSADPTSARLLGFLRRRQPAGLRPRCDLRTLCQQIEEYVEQALEGRPGLRDRLETSLLHPSGRSEIWLSPAAGARASSGGPATAAAATSILGQRTDRRRARRTPIDELPALWTIKLPWVSDANVIDISSSGVLLETGTKITPGSTLELQLLGQDLDLNVPARMVRAEIAGVDGFGVKYRVAGAFARELDLLGLQRAASPPLTASSLADALARALDGVDPRSGSNAARVRFEHELRRLLPVRDIQIRSRPIVPDRDTESIYFTVPHDSGSPRILQAIFEQGHEPSVQEFRLLKAAASLAAAILELAPESDELRGLQSLTA